MSVEVIELTVDTAIAIAEVQTVGAQGPQGDPAEPAGNDTEVQFNDDGAFGSSTDLAFDNADDEKKLSVGVEDSFNYGDDYSSIDDDGSEVLYSPTGVYPAVADYNEIEIKPYWILNGQKYTSALDPTGYISLEPDGSEQYDLDWKWTFNGLPDGYFVIKYDNYTGDGSWYADVSSPALLENFDDWTTQNANTGFNSNAATIDYGSGGAYPDDTQYHYIEVYAFRIVDGVKTYGGSAGFDVEADGSDAYDITWRWAPIPDADGYTVVKYDDTYSGEYCIDVETNELLEDFTDWSTEGYPTPVFNSTIYKAEYVFSAFDGISVKRDGQNLNLLDHGGPIFYGINPQSIVVGASNGRIQGSAYSINGNIISNNGNFELRSSAVGGNATFSSGFSQSETGSSSGNLLLETRNALNKTTGVSAPLPNGSLTCRTGNGSTNTTPGTYVEGGGVGQVELRGGIGGGAQNGTLNNQGSEGGRLNLVAGAGGSTIGPGGRGGGGGAYQMATGAGGNCTSSGSGQVGSSGNGGPFVAFAGNGGRLFNINGISGNSGDMRFLTGIAWPSNYAGSASSNTGGRGGDVLFRASAGADAANSTVANNGGRAGKFDFEVQRGGDGDTSQGAAGSIVFRVARPGKNSTDTSQGSTGNIVFQPSPAAYVGASEGFVCLATTSNGTKTGRVAFGKNTADALCDVEGDVKLGVGGAVFQAVLSATATLDFPSIGSNSTEQLTMTVTGAAVGDVVSLGPPSTIEAGLVWSGFVSAENTVAIRVHNTSGGSVNPASATWRAMVTKF
jgi:hypothetical protein